MFVYIFILLLFILPFCDAFSFCAFALAFLCHLHCCCSCCRFWIQFKFQRQCTLQITWPLKVTASRELHFMMTWHCMTTSLGGRQSPARGHQFQGTGS